MAVFACGLDIVYPAENAKLAREIMEHGALISEYPLGTKPKADNFPRRNRIMSGLSLGVLVIEAGESSGALITANQALEQNREVFAVPGSILSPASRGTNHLIQEGAKLVRNYVDILEELNLTIMAQQLEMKELLPVDETESLLLKQLSREPTHIDDICRHSGLAAALVGSALTMMELKGNGETGWRHELCTGQRDERGVSNGRIIMATKLVVVESPAKARTISRILGKGYEIKATLGHVRDLPKSELGIDVENDFAPRYIIIRQRRAVINELKKSAAGAAEVYLATDPDREGEAISWHLIAAAKLDNGKIPIHRVVFHEITKEAVEKAFRHPRSIDMNLVDAQQARRLLDRLVGYKLSPLLWRKVQRGLSAGRVQSAALRIIVDREREIQNFVRRVLDY